MESPLLVPGESPYPSKLEPLITDERLWRIMERLSIEHPGMVDRRTDMVTMVIPPPFRGPLPDGTVGETPWPLARFMALSPHPRKRMATLGVRHGTGATVWKSAWDLAERQRKHYVTVGEDPAYRILKAVLVQHLRELDDLSAIMN